MTCIHLYGDPSNVTYTSYAGEWGHLVVDMDGTLTGHAGHALTTTHPMIRNESCLSLAPQFGYHLFFIFVKPTISLTKK